ncbi:MAG: hypothetical protein COA78_33295 [Blastopirellula sp.]|nr:MAG: hypothetical protein COA78_33295 [Blastopirellula sp.]
MHTMFKFSLLLVGLLLLQGCSSSDEATTYPVTGTVTFNGEPVSEGSIVFDPADGQGPSAMGGITNGQITAQVPPGEKIVRISAVKTLDKKDEYGEAITESLISDKFNTNSKLTASVSDSGENALTFELKE